MVQYGARSIFLVPLVHALQLSKKNKKNKKNKKKKKKKKKKKNTKCEKCRGRYLCLGTPSLGSKVSYVHYSVPTSSW